MKRIEAQFRPRRRPSRLVLAGLVVLGACAVSAVAAMAWERHRVSDLHAQLAQLTQAGHSGVVPPPPRPTPPYDASARQFLRERAAPWAPMLRTLESGAMIGVTPTSVEFTAADGIARVELNYSDSAALYDYLGRINDGVEPAPGLMRWTLVQTRLQPAAAAQSPTGNAPGAAPSGKQAVATIRSVW